MAEGAEPSQSRPVGDIHMLASAQGWLWVSGRGVSSSGTPGACSLLTVPSGWSWVQTVPINQRPHPLLPTPAWHFQQPLLNCLEFCADSRLVSEKSLCGVWGVGGISTGSRFQGPGVLVVGRGVGWTEPPTLFLTGPRLVPGNPLMHCPSAAHLQPRTWCPAVGGLDSGLSGACLVPRSGCARSNWTRGSATCTTPPFLGMGAPLCSTAISLRWALRPQNQPCT